MNPGHLSDEQMVGQLFVAYVYGAGPDEATSAQRAANMALYDEATPAAVVRRWHLGGVLLIDHNDLDPARPQLSTGNVGSAGQIRSLTMGLQAAADADSHVPLLVSTDQEGGLVQRIRNGVTPLPAQAQLAGQSTGTLTCTYSTLGRELLALGVNQDYAPVADVVRSSRDAIGTRSFGTDPSAVGRQVSAAVAGLQSAGVLATLKHWPGLGASRTDSHQALPLLTQDRKTWERVDRAPFAMARDAAAIMVGHAALPALTGSTEPATLSRRLIEGELREGVGYRGLVVTDSLWMAPMRSAGSPADVAKRAISAGADMLLMSPDIPAAAAGLVSWIRTDAVGQAAVRAAAAYVLAAKSRVADTRSAATSC